jgi:hypothetical protein
MQKKITYLLLLLLPVLLMAMTTEGIMSFGAPVSSTGAPGEVNCSTSGCHDDAVVNAGNAKLSLSLDNNLTAYEPGKTYPVTVQILEQGVSRFGFQLVALKDADAMNAGDLALVDADRTQLVNNDIELKDRKYATYTFDGTAAYAPGVGQWTINWTAPEKDAGPVTLYVAAVSANNDNKDKGDHVYTTALTLKAAQPSGINNVAGKMDAQVFMNGLSNELIVKVNLANQEMINCTLYDVQGRLIKKLFEEKTTAADKRISLDLTSGIYLVKLSADGKEKVAKILVQ